MQLLLSSWQGPVMSLNGELLLIEVTRFAFARGIWLFRMGREPDSLKLF